MADPYAGDVGDGIERAGLQLADRDVQVAGAWFHGFLIFDSWQKKYFLDTTDTVGASLLAMGSLNSASMATDPPLSRASSLPQGFVVSGH
ncbi:hypothetical protein D3C78_1674580 [compost metagenome]